jgi:hypothetical protein
MKLVRPLLIIVGVLIMLGALAAGLALVPALQRRVILRVAEKHPAWHLQLDEVSAGFSSVSLRGLQLEHRGVKVALAELRADYSLWAWITGRRLQIGRLTARGLLVDGSQLSTRRTQAGLAAAPAAVPGALAEVRLPWELTLDDLDLQGRVVLAGAAGQPPQQGEFTLNGGRIGPGRDGEVRLKARMTDPAPGARVTGLDVLATLQLRESPRLTFDHINLTSLLVASGPGLSGQNQLKLVAEMSRVAAGENYHITLDTLRAGQGESLLRLNSAPVPGDHSYTGDWALSVRSAQVESFLLGRSLPKFQAGGSGRFTYLPATAALAVQGALQVEASEIEKFRPELHALGLVRLQSNFDVTVETGVVRFQKLEIGLAGEQPVLDLRTIGSPAYNLKLHRLEPSGPAAGEILRLKLYGLLCAWLAPFCSTVDFSGGPITGEIAVTQTGNNQLALRTVTPLQIAAVTVARAGRTFLPKSVLKIDAEAELSALQVRATIRAFTLQTAAGDTLQGKLAVTAPQGLRLPIAVEGDFSADLPALLPAGPLKARGAFGFNWQGDRVELLRLAAESTDAKGDLLGSVLLSRPFTYELTHGRAETGVAQEVPLAVIKLGQLPLVTLPRVYADYGVSGRLGPAVAVVSAIGGKLMLRASAPLSVADFSVARQRQTVLDRLKLQWQPEVEFSEGELTRVQTGALTLRTGAEVPLAELSAEFKQADSGLRAVGTFSLDLPAWSALPALSGRDALSSGQASGEVRAAFAGGATQIEARATINGMVAAESGQTLPVANLNLRADADAAGHFTLQAPVLLDRAGQRSDLHFSAEGVLAPKGLSFDAKLTSGHIELPDILLLLAVAGSPLGGEGAESPSAQARALSPPAADVAAFWSGTNGHLTVDCQSVVSGPDWAMHGLTGRLTVDQDQLQLENLEATFDEKSRFAAKGTLSFAAGLNPYHLTGDFSLAEFDAGRFFKALDAERTPTVEGVFTVKAQVEGQGLNFDDTLDRTRGTYDLTSRKGVFRGLKRVSDKPSLATKAVGLVSSLIGDKSAEKIAGNASYYVDQLAQEIGEIPYDQFTVRLVRDPALNLRLENFTLVAQQIRLMGSGQVTYVAGKPLLEQPLEATLSFRARGKIEEVLGKLKALDGTRDELGYAKTKEALALKGTLARPDPTSFFAQLAAAKLIEQLAPEN